MHSKARVLGQWKGHTEIERTRGETEQSPTDLHLDPPALRLHGFSFSFGCLRPDSPVLQLADIFAISAGAVPSRAVHRTSSRLGIPVSNGG